MKLENLQGQGLELSLEHQLENDLAFELKTLLVETEVRKCPENPSIAGNRFAQAPNHRTTATLLWTPSPWWFRLDAHHESNRYDDALNGRLLKAAFSLDLSLDRNLSDNSRIRLSVDNLTDEETQTGLSSGGIISTGAPRNLLLGLEWWF